MVDVMLRFGVMTVMALGVLQDPTTSLPDAYSVQFENDYVRVVRVHYDAGVKLREHTHPGGTTVYVYLNDSEGVVFSHVGGSNRTVTRPAVKAGAIRIASGPEEHHTAENPSSTASDFLRIQLKMVSGGNWRKRIPAGQPRANGNAITVDYNSDQLVIQRFIIAPGKSMVAELVSMPSLWIATPSGDTRWIETAQAETISNSGSAPRELIRLIVKNRDDMTSTGYEGVLSIA
jgi:quercetin dioxygenase-like cupin family protein